MCGESAAKRGPAMRERSHERELEQACGAKRSEAMAATADGL
jgi:hypothetical protein